MKITITEKIYSSVTKTLKYSVIFKPCNAKPMWVTHNIDQEKIKSPNSYKLDIPSVEFETEHEIKEFFRDDFLKNGICMDRVF